MKYQIGICDDCYIDINGEPHIPFPEQAIKRGNDTVARLKMWINGQYTNSPVDAYQILYGRIARLNDVVKNLIEQNETLQNQVLNGD